MDPQLLQLQNVSKNYGAKEILRQITLDIDIQEIVGLAGPSGGGKSTLLRLIQGLEYPTQGQIDCPVKTGFMFQDFQLFPHMSVWKNITYAPALKAPLDETATHHLLKALGIESLIHEYPGQLSGGQKQRVALARSLLMKPAFLLCDEPTSGLDVATTKDVSDLLRFVQNYEKVGMLIASHDLDFLTAVCQRIVVMQRGEIVADLRLQNAPEAVQTLKQFYTSTSMPISTHPLPC